MSAADPGIKNAQIESTMLGLEDHGIPTCMLMLKGGGWGIGFGGYHLGGPTGYGMAFIQRILETVGVEKWEQLPGQYVRVETEGWGGKAIRLGHIIDDKWFNPEAEKETLGAQTPDSSPRDGHEQEPT